MMGLWEENVEFVNAGRGEFNRILLKMKGLLAISGWGECHKSLWKKSDH